ncbi:MULTISPECIES: NAD(P)-dependent alcohol dehydrogenase [Spirosoma]|uniref:NAD(P)-dependent alcohol dehydrogenase n=1 Tax=Spirosoma sordidisoli TaxID=2502893 RepID=A0A4Q2UMR2_9BACT|nr:MULTISPECIES: NAD(P)-dependent alcohol dehydrogenase [Spirosoma]RYC68860.1 NAD(P)-dependent alcohol dehydrogenase [Spirosoma sordidisoli]
MKAAIHTHYGPPEVVQIREVDKPTPGPRDLLIRVYASTVNRTDCGFRSAEYVISRLFSGLLRPKQQTLGCEFAGQVEAVGTDVTLFRPGDRVFGFNDSQFGGHAEYMTLPEDAAVTTIPAGLAYDEAAPIAEGAHYALCNIRASGITRGQKALVYGATGAIGSAAVQLLRQAGVVVTAVCASPHVGLVRSLGADRVIDYTREDFTKTGEVFQVVFDAVGKSSFGQCKPILSETGNYISTELGKNGENVFRALLAPLQRGKKVLFPLPTTTRDDIVFLRDLVSQGAFRPVIDRRYPLSQIVDAYRYVETGQKIGNVVITLA